MMWSRFTFRLTLLLVVSSSLGFGQEKGTPHSVDHHMEFCLAVVNGNTMYVTRQLRVPAEVLPQKAFADFITQNYGKISGGASCIGGAEDPARFEADRQSQLDQFRRNPKMKIVDVEWTPPSAPPAKPAAAQGEVPSAPHPNAQTAYEQAMAAQRPRSVTQEQLAAAAAKKPAPSPHPNRASTTPAATASAGPSTEQYVYCSSTGSPYRGTAQPHVYVTQIFLAPAGNPRPAGAFGVYLHKQYPAEDNHAECSPASPLSTVQNLRRSFIDWNRKSFPERPIVELDWKPTS